MSCSTTPHASRCVLVQRQPSGSLVAFVLSENLHRRHLTSAQRDHANVYHRFVTLVKKAGLPRIPFHGLRHNHATLLMKLGVNPKVASERLGHADISITLQTYSHVLPQMQQEAANIFAAAVAEG